MLCALCYWPQHFIIHYLLGINQYNFFFSWYQYLVCLVGWYRTSDYIFLKISLPSLLASSDVKTLKNCASAFFFIPPSWGQTITPFWCRATSHISSCFWKVRTDFKQGQSFRQDTTQPCQPVYLNLMIRVNIKQKNLNIHVQWKFF